ncbi:MAG: ribonuclease III [Eubacterium sp.]|nr:ribonuclease III [Eubacterium sp.]
MNREIAELQEKIGYSFKDIVLLEQALTHSSFANEIHGSAGKGKDNERMEFLGDAVLEIVTSEYLYKKHPDYDEGRLSKTRASIVCEPTLDMCARQIDLSGYIRLGKGEEAGGGRKRPSIVSDAMEAVIGAIYLDGGFEVAERYIYRFILDGIEGKKLYKDSKTALQEITQKKGLGSPEYKLAGEEGPGHDKTFYVELYIDGRKICTGSGHSKKAAEKHAALETLKILDSEWEDVS